MAGVVRLQQYGNSVGEKRSSQSNVNLGIKDESKERRQPSVKVFIPSTGGSGIYLTVLVTRRDYQVCCARYGTLVSNGFRHCQPSVAT